MQVSSVWSSTAHEYYDSIVNRLRALMPGQKIVYYTGFLDGERIHDPFGPASMAASVALDMAHRGLLILTQQRLGPPLNKRGIIDWNEGKGRGFNYIATGALPKKRR